MGYEAPANILNLRYERHPGLEVRARSVPLGLFVEISNLFDSVQAAGPTTTAAAAAMGQVESLFERFADALESWNVTVDGKPVPPTVEGLLRLDALFALEIIHGWIGGIGGVDAPLDQPSPDGSPSLEASMPMEPSLPSLAS